MRHVGVRPRPSRDRDGSQRRRASRVARAADRAAVEKLDPTGRPVARAARRDPGRRPVRSRRACADERSGRSRSTLRALDDAAPARPSSPKDVFDLVEESRSSASRGVGSNSCAGKRRRRTVRAACVDRASAFCGVMACTVTSRSPRPRPATSGMPLPRSRNTEPVGGAIGNFERLRFARDAAAL